jgi:hypothetical protein
MGANGRPRRSTPLLAAHPERGALADQISAALDDAVAGDHLESRGNGRHGNLPGVRWLRVSKRSNRARWGGRRRVIPF